MEGFAMTILAIHNAASRDKALAFIAGLNIEKRWILDIRLRVKKRSLSQNALYWKWCTEIAAATGHAKDEIHQILMVKFLAPRVIMVGDKEYHIYGTSRLSTPEFAEYMNQVHAFAAGDLGIYLTLPEEDFDRHDP